MRKVKYIVLILFFATSAQAWDRLCPVCKPLHIKSRVYIGETKASNFPVLTYYDEKGYLQIKDPNTYTTEYKCSRGHRFIIKNHAGKETIKILKGK